MTAPEPRPRLRPGVAVTPLRAGLHLRGRGTSLTLEGSRALPALWRLLAAGPATGPGEGQEPAPGPADPQTPPAVAAALATLTARLREHDLLVDAPAGAGVPPWPGSAAARPQEAAAALAAARPLVTAADPDGPLARAVVRALARGGAAPTAVPDTALPAGRVLVVAGQPAVALAVQCDADGGFVTAPADPARTRADAEALAARLREGADPAASSASPPPTLPALLAAAAAHRLLCAVAGLTDPGDPAEDPRLLATRPAVLVADARPPRAEHHPWAAAPGPRAAPPADLAEALRRIAALGDPRLGLLERPTPGDLPQLPVALVSCRTPAGLLVAGAVRTDLARLAAACRAVELHLAAVDPAAPVVGADRGDALGRALRRACLADPVGGPAVPDAAWRHHPQAAHWCAALTRALGRPLELTVRQLKYSGAFLAEIDDPAAAVPDRAVEATPADAVTVAALAALTRRSAAGLRLPAARHTTLTGSAAALATAGPAPAPWTDEGWTDRWLTGLATREERLQTDLRQLTDLRAVEWRPATPAAQPWADALHGCGLTALVTTGGRT
ncbi:hypothetical protein ACIRS1_18785 [Kitasatospora sp. NPDC101176]|uniref:hypothetical protein n=1 Tax=Kitasatospora sp. NPDC101176 TaxID=3364099 RepID=UPI0037FD9D1D